MPAAFDDNVDITLEVRWAVNPLATTGTWTDISAYVRSGSVGRGRTSSINSVNPGRMTVQLDNADGRFDPLHASGAYAPNVDVLKQVRLLANYNNTGAVALFTGFIDQLEQDYIAGGRSAVTTLKAHDGFKITSLLATTTQENQEATGTRIGNLLDYALWPSAWRDLDAGTQTVIFLQTECTTLTQTIRAIEDAEGGWFYFDAAGNATFRDRNHRTSLLVSATFGDGGGSQIPYLSLPWKTDDTDLRNDVSVRRIGGTTQTVTDAPSQSSYGIKTLKQLDLPFTTDAASLSLANLLLARYKDSRQDIGPLVLDPRAAPSLAWPQVINREFGDKVTVVRDPGYGVGVSEAVYLEGLRHSFTMVGGRKWQTAYSLSQVA